MSDSDVSPLPVECSICFDKITDRAVLVPCLHEFDQQCANGWVKDHNTCPLCRQEVDQMLFNIKSDSEFESKCIEKPYSSLYNDMRIPGGHVVMIRTNQGLIVLPGDQTITILGDSEDTEPSEPSEPSTGGSFLNNFGPMGDFLAHIFSGGEVASESQESPTEPDSTTPQPSDDSDSQSSETHSADESNSEPQLDLVFMRLRFE